MPYARKDQITWSPGYYYHIFNRGARRLTIFREPDNYHFVLYRVKEYSRQFNLTIIAYCLMPNHYHFLVRQNGEDPAGLLPQRVFNSYTKAYNKRYSHSGTIFERRYQAILVEQERYLKHLCRYIHLNPHATQSASNFAMGWILLLTTATKLATMALL
jgi:putative transposase